MRFLLVPVITMLAACQTTAPAPMPETSDIRFVSTDAIRKAGLPLSNFVEADGWLFLSGMLGTQPGKGLVKGGVEAETRQTMTNIKDTLAK